MRIVINKKFVDFQCFSLCDLCSIENKVFIEFLCILWDWLSECNFFKIVGIKIFKGTTVWKCSQGHLCANNFCVDTFSWFWSPRWQKPVTCLLCTCWKAGQQKQRSLHSFMTTIPYPSGLGSFILTPAIGMAWEQILEINSICLV